MQADSKVKLVRDAFPIDNGITYLDTGSVGPVSRHFAGVLAQLTEQDVCNGRAQNQRFERIETAANRIRATLAGLLAATAEEIELTTGTTDAIRRLLHRYPWQDGDEIVTTQLEFPRCTDALRDATASGKVELRTAEVPETEAHNLDWLESCITPNTRLIAFSGISYRNGQRLPAKAIAQFASSRGIHTLMDGAQLVGAAPLDLADTRIDFLAMPLQKWLCGPEGLGALFTRQGALASDEQVPVSHGWPLLEATSVHLQWLADEVGFGWIAQRTHELSRYAHRALADTESVRLITPTEHAGLVSVQYREGEYERLAARLADAGLIVRHRPEFSLFRISTAFFNTEADIDRFSGAIR